MIKIQIKKLLKKNNKSKYWFVNNMKGGYQSLSKLINNESTGIKFETIDKMCKLFDCEVGDLIEFKDDNKKKVEKKKK